MTLLDVRDIRTRYGSIEALKGISLMVDEGEVVTLIGSNGAGKTTTLRSISGLTPASQGTITFAGEDITRVPAHEIVSHGIALAPEGRHCFPRMTVRENLELGAYRRRGAEVAEEFDRVYELFPVLKERDRQKAGTMSGGEQQMLAIGRALMARPKLLMLDEPSLGIAPNLVQRIYQTIGEIHDSGVAILLVEQNANYALDAASRGYVLETGRVVLANDSASLRNDPEVQNAYLGTLSIVRIRRVIDIGTIGAKALYLLFAWLISAAAASWLSERKGYGERVGLTLGLLLTVLGLLIMLALPGRPGSKWKVQGWLPRRRRPA